VCSVVVRFLRVEDLLYMGGIGAKGTPFIILVILIHTILDIIQNHWIHCSLRANTIPRQYLHSILPGEA
jgi:hypothetical protein